jgi:Na+(H+)/acetate symporter ActP
MPSVVKATIHFVIIVAFVGIPMWVGIVWPRANSKGAWASVIGSSAMFFAAQKMGLGEGGQLLSALLVGFALAVIVSLATRPEPADRLRRFFTLLHTPVGEEKNLERVDLKVMAD